MKVFRIVLVIGLLLSFTGLAHAYGFIPSGAIPNVSVAQMGMGGLTTVVSSNAHTVLYNPGMLTRQKFVLEVTPQFSFDSDVLDMAQFISDHESDFASFESLSPEAQSLFLQDAEPFDNEWYGIGAHPFAGLGWKNFGIATYAEMAGNVKLDLGVLVPAVAMRGYMDAGAAVGFGKNMTFGRKGVGMGLAFRYFERYEVSTTRISATDASNTPAMMEALLNELEDPRAGFGLDLGAVHTLEFGDVGRGASMDVAAVIQDLYGSLDGEYIEPNLKFGAMYHGTSGGFLLRRFDLGLELTDALNREGVSFWQKINMGGELGVLGGLLNLRGGFHQGYPTYGLGVRFLMIKVDIASYTNELGTSPGQVPDEQFYFQVSVGW